MYSRPNHDKVLRQLDIATSQTIAIEIICGVGKVADDNAPLSLWALGDQMQIRVWQQKVSMGTHACIPARVCAQHSLASEGEDQQTTSRRYVSYQPGTSSRQQCFIVRIFQFGSIGMVGPFATWIVPRWPISHRRATFCHPHTTDSTFQSLPPRPLQFPPMYQPNNTMYGAKCTRVMTYCSVNSVPPSG